MEKLLKQIKKNQSKIIVFLFITMIAIIGFICYGFHKSEKNLIAVENLKMKASETVVPEGYKGIYSAEDLANVTNELSGNYILMEDIDMSEESCNIIGQTSDIPFTGIFDGNFHTISNLVIESSNQYVGLFGYIKNGAVKDLNLENQIIKATSMSEDIYAGGLVGYNESGNIENVKITGINKIEDVSTYRPHIGGLIGYQNGGHVLNSYVEGEIVTPKKSTIGYIGGLIGYAYRAEVIEENYSKINITSNLSNESYIGGLIAFSWSDTAEGLIIRKNHARVNIDATAEGYVYVGGLVGKLSNINIIEESYAIGNIKIGSNNGYVGGLVGNSEGNATNNTNISNVYTDVKIISIDNNSATIGGLIGDCNNTNISNTYVIGKIEGINDKTGGLLGAYKETNNVTIVNSYWAPEIVGINIEDSIVAGEVRTIQDMLDKTIYTDWDFTNIWKIEENGESLPYLLNNKEDEIVEANIDHKVRQGRGTAENPFLIYNVEQLQWIERLNDIGTYYYKLMENIDAENYEGFTPIGQTERIPFRGILDGNGKTISNLKIESSNQYVGLFGYINGGTVKNLTLDNEIVKGSYTSGTSYVGGIVGYNESGIIEGVHITGLTKIEDASQNCTINLGGLVGYQNRGQIRGSYVEGEIVTPENSYVGYLGGLIGYAYRMDKVEESSTKVNIQNNLRNATYLGGIIGFANNDTTEGLIFNKNYSNVNILGNKVGSVYAGGLIGYTVYKNAVQESYAIGNITVETNSGNLGGLIGYTESNIDISNSYSNVEIEKSKDNSITVGGIVGRYNGGTISNVYAIGKIPGTNGNIGGLVGYYLSTPTVINSYWAPETVEINITKSTAVGEVRRIKDMLNKENYTEWDFENVWKIEEGSLPYLLNNKETEILEESIRYKKIEGEGTEEEPFLIHNIQELQYIENLNNIDIYYYKLMNDIDAKDYQEFMPIGENEKTPFRGILDGDGKTISNLRIESSNKYVGLFGYINGGTVKNLTLENEIVKGANNSGDSYIGGIAGYNETGSIEGVNIIASSKVEDSSQNSTINLGGLVGYQKGGQVKKSYVEGEIITPEKITYGYLGGLIGNAYIMDKIEESSTKVSIQNNLKSTTYIGGLIGLATSNTTDGLTFNRDYSKVEILGNKEGTVYAGGLIGYAEYKNVIQESYAIGNITVETNSGCIGGLIGYINNNTNISNAYSNVEIERGRDNSIMVGGLVGRYYSGTISNVYAIGKVHGINGSIGGLIGNYYYTPTITNSYWLPETVGISTTNSTVGGEAKRVQEMLYKENYTEWDFENIWKIEEEGKSLPYLLNNRETEILEENINYGRIEGRGTEEEPFLIHNIVELQYIENLNNIDIYYYKLMNDIDAKDYEGFMPIGENEKVPFRGILDGNGMTISNLRIESSNQYVGLFGYINGGTVKNLALDNEIVKGTYTLSGESYIGGVVGYSEAGLIEGIHMTGVSKIEDATANTINIGGLIGKQQGGQVKASYVEGEIITPEKTNVGYLGGLIGFANRMDKVEESSTKIKIQNNLKSAAYSGGLIGLANSDTTEGLMVNKNYSRVSILGNKVGTLYVGGLIGSANYKNVVQESYAIGNIMVETNSGYIGGLIGYINSNTEISNAYSNVEIERTKDNSTTVGGLVGHYYSGTISNVYAIGKIHGINGNRGGLIGSYSYTPTITNSYWSPETEEISTTKSTVGGEAKTIQEMLYKENYTEWDFENVWKIEENGESLPYLLSNKEIDIEKENIGHKIKEGKGTEEEPFLIHDAEELQYIENLNYKNEVYYYKLMNDIDAKNYEGFIPIGQTIDIPFKGILDGDGKTISNLRIESSNQYVGLFGYINGGTVKNLILENETVKGTNTSGESYIGGISGYNEAGLIEGVCITASSRIEDATSNTINIGGLVGYQKGGQVKASYVEGEIVTSERSYGGYLGGLIGYAYRMDKVEESSTKISIQNNLKSAPYVGGLIGRTISDTTEGLIVNKSYTRVDIEMNSTGDVGGLIGETNYKNTINETYAIGSIDIGSNSVCIGGLIGDNNGNNSEINNVYASVQIKRTKDNSATVGGLLGYSSNTNVNNTYAVGKIEGVNGNVGGLIASNSWTTITNSYWSPETIEMPLTKIQAAGESEMIQEMLSRELYSGWDFSGIWKIEENKKSLPYLLNNKEDEILAENIAHEVREGKGTEEDPFLIYDMEQLQWIERLNDIGTYYYKLMENIDSENYEGFTPIGKNASEAFRGVLDGNGKTISNLKIESSNQYVGLFGYINGGTVKNLTLENEIVKGTNTSGESYIGGIVGYNDTGIIEGVHITGTSKIEDATSYTINLGGLVGYQKSGQVKTSYAEGEIITPEKSNYGYIGGLVGNAYRMDKMEESSTKVSIQNNLKSETYLGGLIGLTNSDTTEGLIFNKNYSKVNILGNKTGTVYVGGLIGYANYKNVVQESYVIGNITVETNSGYVGGLIGYTGSNTDISNAYSNVEIERAKDNSITVGGLVGRYYSGTISNVYAIGKVHGIKGTRGGLIGHYYNTPTIVNSYWLPEKMEMGIIKLTEFGEARKVKDMLNKENYTEWDFENVWKIEENGESLPYLLNNKEDEILEVNIEYKIKEGKGTEEEPFLIHNVEELQYIENLNYMDTYYYKLMNDIEAKDYEGFTPIGQIPDVPFRGILDGNGKTISNLKIESANQYVGLFGYINSGIVKNLILENQIVKGTNTSGESYIGGISGYNEVGLIEGVRITGSSRIEDTTSNTINLGGLVGYQKGGQVKASYVEGEIVTSERSYGGYLGGLIGNAYRTDKVEESSTKVSIQNNLRSTTYLGGLIGFTNSDTTEGLIISKNYSKVDILGNTAGTVYAGGLIGYANYKNIVQESYAIGNIKVETNSGAIGGLIGDINNDTDISNIYSNVEIERAKDNTITVGGLVGYYYRGTISNAYAIGKVHGINGSRGGLIGNYYYTPTIINSYWSPEKMEIGTIKLTEFGEARKVRDMLNKENYTEWDFENVWKIEENGESLPYLLNNKEDEILEENIECKIKEGKGTEDDPFLIYTMEQLQYIENLNYVDTYSYKLMNDIDAKDYEGFTPIGQIPDVPFRGILDGNGKTIINLTIESSNKYVGLFGYINEGIVKNLNLKNEMVKGTFTSGENYIGGIAGYQKGGELKSTYVEGEISTLESSSVAHIGGLIGYADRMNKIDESNTKITIQNNLTNTTYIGGLIGHTNSNTTEGLVVNKSYSKLNIEGNSTYTGGLIGYAGYKNIVQESYAIGNIEIRNTSGTVGGLIGYVDGNSSYYTDISNAYSNVEIKRTENNNSTIGALIGYSYFGGNMNNTYAIGNIERANEKNGTIGGLIGNYSNKPTVINSYWTPETVGISATKSIVVGETRRIKDMLNKDNYTEWDFENVWKIEENEESLPYLLNNKETEILDETIEYRKIEGEGTEEEPFLIYTMEQLQYINNLNDIDVYYYKLMNDIEAKDYEGFIPIGENEKAPFRGILDGNGKTISNLRIESSNQYVGLFGYIKAGTVKNITLENEVVKGTYASGESYIGGLAGYNETGNIEGVRITGTSKIEDASTYYIINIGGLVGKQQGGQVM